MAADRETPLAGFASRARTAPRGPSISDCRSPTRPAALAAIFFVLLLAGVSPASATASPGAKPLVIHVRDLAHYPLSYVRQVDRAVEYQVNHQLHRLWHTPLVRFDAPSTETESGGSWHVDVLPTTKVWYGFFNSASGFHLPGPPIDIEVAGRSKTMPMSLILSHEVIEALVDPRGNQTIDGVLSEVCDPAEQPAYQINGITVSNFVTPRWFSKSATGGRFDFQGLLSRPLTVSAQGFMPGNASAKDTHPT
jgi:hypothetical protein